MRDFRDINVLHFDDNGTPMSVVLVLQRRTRLVMDQGTCKPVTIEDIVYWPLLEVPECDLNLDEETYTCPIIKEAEDTYGGWFLYSARLRLSEGRPAWNGEMSVRPFVGSPSAVGKPLPTTELSDAADKIVRDYVARLHGGSSSNKFGPDLQDYDEEIDLNRGLDPRYCKAWDAPFPPSLVPTTRELVILQSASELLTILIRTYERSACGQWIEVFSPVTEVSQAELGSDGIEKLERLKNNAYKYGCDSVKWIRLDSSGDWLSGTVFTGGTVEEPMIRPPSIAELKMSADVVKSYLTWRAVAYCQEIKLVRSSGDIPCKPLAFFP